MESKYFTDILDKEDIENDRYQQGREDMMDEVKHWIRNYLHCFVLQWDYFKVNQHEQGTERVIEELEKYVKI